MITMSTNEIKAFNPCEAGWKRLLTGLNKSKADDEQIPFVKFLETNEIDEVFWAMRVKWFQHKETFMNVVNAAVERAAYYAADAAERAADTAYYAVDARHAASCAARAAFYAAYNANATAEREQQKQDIIKFCS